jgi:hypothetical protein
MLISCFFYLAFSERNPSRVQCPLRAGRVLWYTVTDASVKRGRKCDSFLSCVERNDRLAGWGRLVGRRGPGRRMVEWKGIALGLGNRDSDLMWR